MTEITFEYESIDPGSKIKLFRDSQELEISMVVADTDPDYMAECAQMIAEDIDRRILEMLDKKEN